MCPLAFAQPYYDSDQSLSVLKTAKIDKGFADAGKINDIVTTLKKEGFVAATHKKWFGTTPPDSSSSVKVMDVPKL